MERILDAKSHTSMTGVAVKLVQQKQDLAGEGLRRGARRCSDGAVNRRSSRTKLKQTKRRRSKRPANRGSRKAKPKRANEDNATSDLLN